MPSNQSQERVFQNIKPTLSHFDLRNFSTNENGKVGYVCFHDHDEQFVAFNKCGIS